ncbi:hypothetical protein ACFL2V_11150 [Pseudomonadota bacterium]
MAERLSDSEHPPPKSTAKVISWDVVKASAERHMSNGGLPPPGKGEGDVPFTFSNGGFLSHDPTSAFESEMLQRCEQRILPKVAEALKHSVAAKLDAGLITQEVHARLMKALDEASKTNG